MMISIREQRWKRFESAYGRLPIWLQFALVPWTIPARLLAYFPVLTPALCLAGATSLAYLKLHYLHEQVTWSQVGMIGIAPLLLPVVAYYAAFPIAVIGTFLILVPVLGSLVLARWRRGEPLRPFSLDPSRRRKRSPREDRLLWDLDLDGPSPSIW